MLHINWEKQQGARFLVLRIRRGGCLALVALVCAGVLVLAVFTLRIDRFLAADDLAPADAIVVPASAPSRIRHAVNLYAQGYAPVVAFTDATYKDAGLAWPSPPAPHPTATTIPGTGGAAKRG
jgi:hypothetical protein